VLRAAEPEVMVQLVRLVILYEDLKLEIAGLHVPKDKEFDELSKHYREMYFIRRAFATLWEMDSAFHKLNMLPAFKERKKCFDKRRLKEWTDAVRFFSRMKKFLGSQRNAYGGHVNDEVAKFILSKIEDHDDSPAAIEVRFSDDHTGHIVFKFAEQLVSRGRDQRD
jgi:hypothetical protein